MNLRKLEKQMNNIQCFSMQEIKIFEPNFIRLNLTKRHEKGYIDYITKGRYCFSNFQKSEETLFIIYQPSYISMESALRYYNLIPEGVYLTTACSTKKTQKLKGDRGTFF